MSLIEENRELKRQINSYKYDHLTGLKLRYDFETEVQGLLDNGATFYMTMVDVDGLHTVNREYGIKSGDALIQSVAAACKKAPNAIHVYRIGGDEFVIIHTSEISTIFKNAKHATIFSKHYEFVCDMLRDVDKLVTTEKMKTDRRRA